MIKYIVPNWLDVLLKAYSAQIASAGIIAQFILEFGFSISLPWWANIALLGAVLVGRLIPQESVTSPAKEPDYGAGV